jgi:hypothetical protein
MVETRLKHAYAKRQSTCYLYLKANAANYSNVYDNNQDTAK